MVLEFSTFWLSAKKVNVEDDRFVTKIKGISSFLGSLPEKNPSWPEVIQTAPSMEAERHRDLLWEEIGPGEGPVWKLHINHACCTAKWKENSLSEKQWGLFVTRDEVQGIV